MTTRVEINWKLPLDAPKDGTRIIACMKGGRMAAYEANTIYIVRWGYPGGDTFARECWLSEGIQMSGYDMVCWDYLPGVETVKEWLEC